MSSIESQLYEAQSRNKELLTTLAETDYAPPALEQQKRYIADLQTQIDQLDKRIKGLETSRAKELKDHEKYRDSVMKRFAYKVTRQSGKFEAKASKEEQEYYDAIRDEHQAKQMRADIGQTFDAANKEKANLDSIAAKHAQAQRDLDALYDSIFQGPSPGYAEEDEKERAASDALQRFHNTRVRTESEVQVVRILSDAQQRMRRANLALEEARSHSRMDMFGGGAMSDMMERNALNRAEIELRECQMIFDQARRLSPEVAPLPNVNIAQGNIMRDVFFDNIFTDMEFHEKIKQSLFEQQRAAGALEEQKNLAQQRLNTLSGQLKEEASGLESARSALQKAREAAFEKIAASKGQ